MSNQVSTSPWPSGVDMPAFPALAADATADVCVVGAGIAGITTAFLLAREGYDVVVLDDGPVGGGETGRTTAHLSSVLRMRYYELEQLHGEHGARRAAVSHTEAVNLIEQLVASEGIDCDFTRREGYLMGAPGTPAEVLERELAAARRAGIPEVDQVPAAPLRGFASGPCLRFPRQAQFHPLRYLAALARGIVARGGRIHAQSHATEFLGGSDAEVKTAAGPVVRARALVVATNTPVNDVVTIHTKQAAYQTYVIAVPVPRGSVTPALYWDTADPYHYVRLLAGGGDGSAAEHLLVGGEDHKTGQADDADQRYQRLEAWAQVRFPLAAPPTQRWSGQIMEPVDGLAFIGRNPGDRDNVFLATGDAGNGMTHGTIAGMLLTDLIAGRANPWASLYDPARKTLRAAGTYLRENLNVAARYTEWLRGSGGTDVAAIAPGAGAVLREGAHKVAVYRDEHGVLHRRSAACPHLGCVVHWNSAERTWDCPCHGSRFDAHGHVIHGPAVADLAPLRGARSTAAHHSAPP